MPATAGVRATAQIDAGAPQALSEIPGSIGQQSDGGIARGENAAAHAEPGRNQRAAEQRRCDLGQRQHAGDAAIGCFRNQIMAVLSAPPRDRDAPFGQVKGCRRGLRIDPGAQMGLFTQVGEISGAKGERHASCSAAAWAIASTRPQACVVVSARSLPAIAPSLA